MMPPARSSPHALALLLSPGVPPGAPSRPQLHAAGFSGKEMLAAHFTQRDLLIGGYTSQELM